MRKHGFLAIASTFALAWLASLALAPAATAGGHPCTDGYGNDVPGCVEVEGQWDLKEWSTQYNWLYCPSNAQYWWGDVEDDWQRGLYTFWRSSGNANGGYFGMRNTDVARYNRVTVTIGCSPVNPGCNPGGGGGGGFYDPGCPQNNVEQTCQGDGESQTCWNDWNETCSDGSTYSCSGALFATYCVNTTGCD